MISVSIVSHGHGAMVAKLTSAVLGCPEVKQVIVTRNIPELHEIAENDRVTVINNVSPKGFGANHNAAFSLCNQAFFCPLNPDIGLLDNPFPELLTCLAQNGAALVAPMVISPSGEVEDSARHFPTLGSLVFKVLGMHDGRCDGMHFGQSDFSPDWVAGMFMLFRSESFARLGGFDESFFLYYEDVDICVRLWTNGLKLVACPRVCVIHDAQRNSRRNLRHLGWHLASLTRYFWRYFGRLPKVAGDWEVR